MTRKKYSVIIFDLGNVLIPFNYSRAVEKLNNIQTGLGDTFLKNYYDHYHIHRSFEKGEMTEDDFISTMLGWIDHKIDSETFCRYYADIFIVNEDVVSLLPVLKKNYTLVLLSNTNSIHQRYGWQRYTFLRYFDKLILSHEVGSVKPEEKIYRAVEEFSKCPPSEHIFIDDIQKYAQAARNLGWDAIHFNNYNNLVEELYKRKIILE